MLCVQAHASANFSTIIKKKIEEEEEEEKSARVSDSLADWLADCAHRAKNIK